MNQMSGPQAPSASPPGHRAAAAKSLPKLTLGQVALTAVHLVALGVVGWAAFSVAFSLLVAGVSLLLVVGIGAVILVGLVYVLFGLAWFENERVSGLYRLNAWPLAFSPMQQRSFGAWLRSVLRQSVDGRMWLSIVSMGIGTLFGAVMLRLVGQVAWGVFGLFTPVEELGWVVRLFGDWVVSPWAGFVMAIVALLVFFGLAALHALIARAMLGAPTRTALAAEVRTKSEQREGAVRAADLERTRIERDLHDGVQPRLVSIGMTLGLAQQKIDEDPAAARQLVEEAHASTKSAITELRQLARGIHASVLDDRGLDAALSALAGRSHVPVHLDVRMEGRPSATEGVFRDAEAAVYFSIAEALTNAAKHSRASDCRVTVRLRDAGTAQAVIWARIEDNGIGGATVQPGGGLDGISNRVLAAGGTVRLDSPQGGPTSLEVTVPCAF